jgi:hypothetical protein
MCTPEVFFYNMVVSVYRCGLGFGGGEKFSLLDLSQGYIKFSSAVTSTHADI